MSTIGLYDMDFNHGQGFCLSLPLMKAYRMFKERGDVVKMMSPYEKTGRYNRIFYFKENPNLISPQKLILNLEKGSFHGYGFFGANIKEETKSYDIDFAPYDLNSKRIKNLNLYKTIKNNSLIDWREKDFVNYHNKNSTIFVNDQNFMKNEDWDGIFSEFNNTIDFVHRINCESPEVFEKFKSLSKGKIGHLSKIIVPFKGNADFLSAYYNDANVCFSSDDITEILIAGLFCKTKFKTGIPFLAEFEGDGLLKKIASWAASKKILSFQEFLIQKGTPLTPRERSSFKYSELINQNPSTFNEKKASEYLTFL